jgi:sulfur-carrier protein
MARLRLFGPVREAARCALVEIDAGNVGELLAVAVERFGAAFAELVPGCRVWIDGEPATAEDLLDDAKEVALLPPVSGG